MDEKPFKERILFAGEINKDDIDLSRPPTDGEEYIKRVIFEAQQCDEVVYAKIDEAKLKQPTINIKPLPECSQAPESIKPTLEWQRSQIAEFSSLRMYIGQIRDEIKIGKRKRKPCDSKLPISSDQKEWIDLCTKEGGKEESLQIEPKLTAILSINQPTIEMVLEYLVEYLEDKKAISLHTGRWLYSLLAALELPLNPDMCSCLRSLARICSTMRSQLDSSNSNDAVSLNLFICLVARYFRQLDLADP